MDKIENELKEVKDKLAAIKTELHTQEAIVAELEGEIIDLKNKITEVEEEKENLQDVVMQAQHVLNKIL